MQLPRVPTANRLRRYDIPDSLVYYLSGFMPPQLESAKMVLSYGTVVYTFVTSRSAPVIALYLLLIFLSPRLMKIFSPLELRKPLIVHNLICCLLSLCAVVLFTIGFYKDPNFFSTKKDDGYIYYGIVIYWISKLYELLDTVFMILRHRIRQISFLHVFHHSSITMLADWSCFISPIPAVAPVLGLNSMVHVVMYGYYFLTALYPLHSFTWKKRITQMQMIQFLVGITHAVLGYLYHTFCIYSIFYGLSMLILFSNFYYHAFIVKKKHKNSE